MVEPDLSVVCDSNKQCSDEFSVINDLISEKKKQHSIAKETDDHKLRIELSKEIQNLENLLNLLNHIGLNTFDRALLEQKVLIVGGKAGVGKSQLLANAAEKINKDGQYALLMLGKESFKADCYSIQDTFGTLLDHPEAGKLVQAVMDKVHASRGDVAKSTSQNANLQKMLRGMKFESLLKQAGKAIGADQIVELNRAFQAIEKA